MVLRKYTMEKQAPSFNGFMKKCLYHGWISPILGTDIKKRRISYGTWKYHQIPSTRYHYLLDMETGGGESKSAFFSPILNRLQQLEGWCPNIKLCEETFPCIDFKAVDGGARPA